MEEEPEKNMEFDTILEQYVGGGGKWQWRKLFIWLAPVHVACGVPLLLHLFTAYAPSHRCYIEGCESPSTQDFHADFLKFSTPTDHASSTFLRDAEDYDPCQTFVHQSSLCHPRAFDRTTKENCSRYVYDTSEFSETLATKLDLVCDKVNVRHSLGSIMMLGLLTGSLLGGPLSDKIGRKNAILAAIMISVPCTIGGGFVQDFATYAILRYISCTAIVFGWIGHQALKMEYFSRDKRTVVIALDALLAIILSLVNPLIAYFHRDWQSMHIWAGAVCLLALPWVLFGAPESARWLIANNRSRQAEAILKDIAQGNGKLLDEEQWTKIRDILNHLGGGAKNKVIRTKRLNFIDMFSPSLRQITLILILNWVISIVTAYALVLNMNALAGDVFINYVLMEIIRAPGELAAYYFMVKIGRQRSLAAFMFGQGLFALVLAFLPKSNSALILTTFLMAKTCASGTQSVLWLYTAELYPTNLRSQSIGVCSTISRYFPIIKLSIRIHFLLYVGFSGCPRLIWVNWPEFGPLCPWCFWELHLF